MLPIEQFEGLSANKSLDRRRGPMDALAIPDSLINKRMDRFAPDDAREIVARAALAIQRAAKALDALDILGIRAWVVGSLARRTFNVHSDVDFVVDAPASRQRFVLLVIEEAMKDMPFDLVPFDRIPESDREFFMEGSLDASGFRARFTQAGADPEGIR
jgi:predicted nucleotidyltransferase